jgi:hypothetical protein
MWAREMFDVARKPADGVTTLSPLAGGKAESVNQNLPCGLQRGWKTMGALRPRPEAAAGS